MKERERVENKIQDILNYDGDSVHHNTMDNLVTLVNSEVLSVLDEIHHRWMGDERLIATQVTIGEQILIAIINEVRGKYE